MYGNYEMMKRLAKDKIDRQLSQGDSSRRARPRSALDGRVLGISTLLRRLWQARPGVSARELDHRMSTEKIVTGTE